MNRLLVATIALPLAGALAVWALAGLGRNPARWIALVVTLATLAATVVLIAGYPPGSDQWFAGAEYAWLQTPGLQVQFSVGLDGLSVWLFGLSALLMVTSVLVSWQAIDQRAPLFYGMLLLLEAGCLGVFAARDIILFYLFFEFTLIPLFFLIGIWGSEERRYAAIKFFLYTFAGSVLTFLGLLAIVAWHFYYSGVPITFSIPELTELSRLNPLGRGLQMAVFVALFAGFAIKVPLFPLHTWLPLAHVQAPTAGSVFLAGILLKIGTYGFLRFSVPMLPDASAAAMPYLMWLAVAGILYGALVALAQNDMKRLIAYSSVSHLGFVMLGLFALNRLGVQGATLQMVNHGLSTGGLFAVVGMIYERYHTREIRQLGGIARRAPWLAFFMLLFTFSSIGLPGLNGFPGELLVLVGAFQRAFADAPPAWAAQLQVIVVLALLGVVLGAWYMLSLVLRVFFGPLREPHSTEHGGHEPAADMSWREILALAPLGVFIVWIGVQPAFFLSRMDTTLNALSASAETAVAARVAGVEADDAPSDLGDVSPHGRWPAPAADSLSDGAGPRPAVPLEGRSVWQAGSGSLRPRLHHK